jgi:DNA primase
VAANVERILKRLHIQAEKRGDEWFALCPNHVDTTPSWHVKDDPDSKKHGLHNCWSCGFSGDLIDLIRFVNGCSFAIAKEWVGGEATEEEKQPAPTYIHVVAKNERQVRFKFPSEVKFGPLSEFPSPARRYLQERGVTAAEVDLFGFGYATHGRLDGRIIIPIWKTWGLTHEPASYMARDFCDNGKRYLYPAAHENADLDSIFGGHLWSLSPKCIYVTEGAFNALAVRRALGGFVDIGAIGGSSLRPAHARALARFGQVIIVTDSDDAGDKAADELRAALARHTSVLRVRLPLPKGKDANDVPIADLRTMLGANKETRP